MSAKNSKGFWSDGDWVGGKSPRCQLTFRGEKSTEDSRAGCVLRLLCSSQREGVATCLLSVLLQPSCGSTLVDFLEITWHSHWGRLCLCRTLQWSARASSSLSSLPLPPAILKKKKEEEEGRAGRCLNTSRVFTNTTFHLSLTKKSNVAITSS